MSGYEALKLLARNKTSRDIPVVLYSALDEEEAAPHCEHHPLCAFVSKTARLTDLLETIERLQAEGGAA